MDYFDYNTNNTRNGKSRKIKIATLVVGLINLFLLIGLIISVAVVALHYREHINNAVGLISLAKDYVTPEEINRVRYIIDKGYNVSENVNMTQLDYITSNTEKLFHSIGNIGDLGTMVRRTESAINHLCRIFNCTN